MSDQAEVISGSNSHSDDHLSFTEEEVWKHLEDLFGGQPRQPGDVTIKDVSERFNKSYETVRMQMNALVKKGLYSRLKVNDDGRSIIIYRRIVADK